MGTIEKYKNTNGWKEFLWMEEGTPTAINAIKVGEAVKESNRYILSGSQISAPHKGINVVKMSDGTTKKVLVK